MSAIIPGPYGIPGTINHPAMNPVPAPEMEKPLAPSIDHFINEPDHWTVHNLPPEGKQQFTDNVHRYIRQLGKDYLDEADDAAE
jgi:hypothetical protein